MININSAFLARIVALKKVDYQAVGEFPFQNQVNHQWIRFIHFETILEMATDNNLDAFRGE